jgi:hypothetical protein
MMKALHSIQALPGPGEVLKLDAAFLLHPTHDSLFVRECYPRLFDALVSDFELRTYIGRWPALALAYRGAQSARDPSNRKGSTHSSNLHPAACVDENDGMIVRPVELLVLCQKKA